MRILCDLDGVAADWIGGIEDGLGWLPVEDSEWLDWTQGDGASPDAPDDARAGLRRRIKRIQGTFGFYAALRPIPGAVAAIHRLADAGHDVWFCSTPDPLNESCASDKINWVESHFGEGWGERVILTHDKTLVRGDVLIDDKPRVTGAAEPEWTHVIFAQPYNGGPEAIGRWRVRDWEHALRFVEDYARLLVGAA
ncbi:5' nucleotidase, NT5C type [Agromyces larvae]|uniref:Uncharacterized protein n=1 Tax=Agromyces larvae TaxID=2929802 RepID=A0ABY4C4S9_9MICO|nr:hypothetical protein [Agromyces larvae]UOE45974.1 hypothetical protein MTO99_09595 [Agromyces larvae]